MADVVFSLILGLSPCEAFASLYKKYSHLTIGKRNRSNTISAIDLIRKMHPHNADVVNKFIFRYLSVPLNNGYRNIFMDITNKDIPNKLSS
jgi:hypothetical protein